MRFVEEREDDGEKEGMHRYINYYGLDGWLRGEKNKINSRHSGAHFKCAVIFGN